MIMLLFTVIPICFLQEKPFCENKATVRKPTNQRPVGWAMIRNSFCFIWFIQEDRVKRRISFYVWLVRDEFHLCAWMEANSALCHWPEQCHVGFWHGQLDFLKDSRLHLQGLNNFCWGQSFEGAVSKAPSSGTGQPGFSGLPWRYGPHSVTDFLQL